MQGEIMLPILTLCAVVAYHLHKRKKYRKRSNAPVEDIESSDNRPSRLAEIQNRMTPPKDAIFTGKGKDFTLADVKSHKTKKHMLNKVESSVRTIKLKSVSITTRGMKFDYSAPKKIVDDWEASNFGIVLQDTSGQTHAMTFEWGREGQTHKIVPMNVAYDFKHPSTGDVVTMENLGAHVKVNGMKRLWFKEGSKVGFFLTLDNARTDNIGGDDISNVVNVTLTKDMLYPKDTSNLVL